MSKVITQLYRCLICGYVARFRYRAQFDCPFCKKHMSFITSEATDE